MMPYAPKYEKTHSANLDIDLYNARVTERIQKLAKRPSNLIYDASHDRHWRRYLTNFEMDIPYAFGVISFDLSRTFYERLLQATEYAAPMPRIDSLLADHATFVSEHADVIICRITDENYRDRLQVAETAVRSLIGDK